MFADQVLCLLRIALLLHPKSTMQCPNDRKNILLLVNKRNMKRVIIFAHHMIDISKVFTPEARLSVSCNFKFKLNCQTLVSVAAYSVPTQSFGLLCVGLN